MRAGGNVLRTDQVRASPGSRWQVAHALAGSGRPICWLVSLDLIVEEGRVAAPLVRTGPGCKENCPWFFSLVRQQPATLSEAVHDNQGNTQRSGERIRRFRSQQNAPGAMQNVKIVVVGDGHVGKTSLLVRFSTGSFPEGYHVSFDGFNNPLAIDGVGPVNLSLWDTAGQVTISPGSQSSSQLSCPPRMSMSGCGPSAILKRTSS